MPKLRPYRHLAHLDTFRSHPIVFVTCVMHQRRPMLANDAVHGTLRGLWERSAKENGWSVGDYVIMPDHVHLFARPSLNADTLACWVKLWKSVSARGIQRLYPLSLPIWQEDYFDRNLRSTESYRAKWEYVRNNPVRAGLVPTPEDWPYKGCIDQIHQ